MRPSEVKKETEEDIPRKKSPLRPEEKNMYAKNPVLNKGLVVILALLNSKWDFLSTHSLPPPPHLLHYAPMPDVHHPVAYPSLPMPNFPSPIPTCPPPISLGLT
jgi:hypothetical protein